MYNIHALREQWDYYTIATKLIRVIELYASENGYEPNEIELSNETGLSRGQIRRCRLLLDLPEKFQYLLLEELSLPKSQQKLSEDFFIEMERALKSVIKRIPVYKRDLDRIRNSLIQKFREGTIEAVTDFRKLSKIATAVDNFGIPRRDAKRSLDKIFDVDDKTSIRDAFENTVEFEYDELSASRRIQSLTDFIDEVIKTEQTEFLDSSFLEDARRLYGRLRKLLGK